MDGFDEKTQKVANAEKEVHCIIHLGSRGCCKPPVYSRHNSGGSRAAKPSEAPTPFFQCIAVQISIFKTLSQQRFIF